MEDLSGLGLTDEELFSFAPADPAAAEHIDAPRYSYWGSVARVFFRKKGNWLLLGLLLFLLVFIYLYPAVTGYDPGSDPYIHLLDPAAKHLSPGAAMEKFGVSPRWLFGSGASGESTFDAVWYGAGISVTLAFLCAAINLTVGVAVGAVWGFSRRLDSLLTGVYNVVSNVPYILLVSVLVLVLSPGFWTLVFALTVTGWLSIAWFIRTQVLIIRGREYNLASQCLGTPVYRIAIKNILPFLTSVIVTLAATEIPQYISYEVFLSYIGMGLGEMSLGRLIQASQAAMLTPGWELEFWAPVAVASVIAVTLYLMGQSLGDASDPKTHL